MSGRHIRAGFSVFPTVTSVCRERIISEFSLLREPQKKVNCTRKGMALYVEQWKPCMGRTMARAVGG